MTPRVIAALVVAAAMCGASTRAQTDISDAVLERASAGRTVDIGLVSAGGGVSKIPLEVYVARVLAGEAEPGAADAAQQALAVAIRTYAIVNEGRHRREGFDLCDTTHCQVMRAANEVSRRAALATAGRVLTLDRKPVEIFYSASCGGRSESAANVWPGGTKFPYLQSVPDDVHDDEVPWVLTLTLAEIRQALVKAGFGGDRLRGIEIDQRTRSGRVAKLHLSGLRPDAVAGDPFRMAIGPRLLRSTAFSMTRSGNSVRFTGVGYGHGVGMCVIGAGRRARRGETLEAILGQYYPGLALMPLDASATRDPIEPVVAAEPPRAPVTPSISSHISVRVPSGSAMSAGELGRLALRARDVTVEGPWRLGGRSHGGTSRHAGRVPLRDRPPVVGERGGQRDDHRSGAGALARATRRHRGHAANSHGGTDGLAALCRPCRLGPGRRRAVLFEANAARCVVSGSALSGGR